MDRDRDHTKQENPNELEDCSRKPPVVGGGSVGGNDRLKRDEWSEGAVSSLLEAYEAKWVLRNRAKLKGQDWEDVARFVSSRANSSKSPKTQTQCKNKIESMKKRYRSESASASGEGSSSWPLYSRLDLLLRGSGSGAGTGSGSGGGTSQFLPPLPPITTAVPLTNNHHLIMLEPPQSLPLPPLQPLPVDLALPPAPALSIGATQNSHESNGADRMTKEDGIGPKLSDHISDKNNAMETDSSTPAALYSDDEKLKSKKTKVRMDRKKRRRKDNLEIAESIRWLAEVVARSEQARMDTMRELEKLRAEAEAKRGELDLKRTEIIANTQLEIARLFAGVGKGVDSSLRIGRS